eukprot:687121-Rhodomonas_salina.1
MACSPYGHCMRCAVLTSRMALPGREERSHSPSWLVNHLRICRICRRVRVLCATTRIPVRMKLCVYAYLRTRARA